MTIFEYIFSVSFFKAAGVTISLTLASMILGILGGFVLAAMDASKFRPISWFSKFYVWLFRGTPVLLQLIFVFNVLPLWGLKFDPFTCALIALSLNEAAYMSEILRGGLFGVDRGQKTAATMLGLSRWQIFRYVILPQLMRIVLPPTGNQLIGMLKTSALASVVAVQDLMLVAQRTAAGNFDYVSSLGAAAVHYLLLTTLCTMAITAFENHYSPEKKSEKRRRLAKKKV